MPDDRLIGGIRCMEVLALLSDYLDEEVSAKDRGRIEVHVQGCRWCEQFGGAFAGVVKGLRLPLTRPERTPEDVVDRLARHLNLPRAHKKTGRPPEGSRPAGRRSDTDVD